MIEDFDLEKMIAPLLEWYYGSHRVLPWREKSTAYRVWVSEIMLQQTRVEAVIPYYKRFMNALPKVKDLADCEENELLKLWEGLGYYNRVRNMQTAAQSIRDEYKGEFPCTYEKIIGLKGIGSYTAGAIASIAFEEPVPAVDGNVLRVISRLTLDNSDIAKQSTKAKMENHLRDIIPVKKPGDFNQALMELGAVVCIPNGMPHCEKCPWEKICMTHKKTAYSEYPVKKKAAERKIEERTVFLILRGDEILLNKRPGKGLLAGLYEFPNVCGYKTKSEAIEEVKKMNLHPIRILQLEDAKHIFSHVEWRMKAYMIKVDEIHEIPSNLLFANVAQSEERYTIPAAFKRYTSYMKIRLGNEKYQGEEVS